MEVLLAIKVNIIKALGMFLDLDNSPTSMKGIHIEIKAGILYMVATQGHYMAVYEEKVAAPDMTFDIPAEVAFALGRINSTIAHLDIKPDFIKVSFCAQNHSSLVFQWLLKPAPLYPNWRKIITDSAIGDDTALFNPGYIGLLYEVADVLGTSLGLQINGTHKAAKIIYTPEFTAYLMPQMSNTVYQAENITQLH